jgi:hypothetical protein
MLQAVIEVPAYQVDPSNSGYFLTIKHPALPSEAFTLASPLVTGHAGELVVGFVVFLGNHELTLECHAWGADEPPAGLRDMDVTIRVADG